MAALSLIPVRTGLVVIDLQEGIVAMPTAPVSSQTVVERSVRLAEACRKAGTFVVLVHVETTEDGADALHQEADVGPAGSASRPRSWSRIVPTIGPRPGDYVVTKHQWGAFYGTDLDLQLRRRGIDTIILCGISTNVGVESTARDAYERNYRQVLVTDAMAARSREEHDVTVRYIFPRIGLVRSVDEVMAALEA